GFAGELDAFAEAVFSGGDAEADEHFFAGHFLGSLQMLDRLVKGFNQASRAAEVVLQNFAMRLEGRDLLEIGASENAFDLFQLETQLPVKQDLLEHQELRLFVEAVAVRPVIGRL